MKESDYFKQLRNFLNIAGILIEDFNLFKNN
jgi:hypothetical protein